ncbi:hypothetical protein [Methylobacterium sp. B1]|uniref:hypothetical protein n=1 Tax=Methylobacterium sp. B1 TaxID=91459 RepID=UPI0011D25763|nr:hypothetical protein [Methylobacterium sp. B1]
MRRKLTKQEALILRLALESEDGLIVGRLTIKYGSSVREIFQAYSSLNADGLLRMDEGLIVLTTLGRNWINENQHLFAFSGEKTWRQVPPTFQASQIQPFEPYAPRRSRLRHAVKGAGQAAGGD